jgi:hypothetical protein
MLFDLEHSKKQYYCPNGNPKYVLTFTPYPFSKDKDLAD